MSLDTDDEILQDFIIEAGEILELLSEQLVQLEKTPTDTALLNAIFRGFHTIKGGAGFLSLTNLINICHISENVFDLLRQGKRTVDANLMDLILKAVDTINIMFAEIKAGQIPNSAEATLLENLESLIKNVPVVNANSDDNKATQQNMPSEPERTQEADKQISNDNVATNVNSTEQTQANSDLSGQASVDNEDINITDNLSIATDNSNESLDVNNNDEPIEQQTPAAAIENITNAEHPAMTEQVQQDTNADTSANAEPVAAKENTTADDEITEEEFDQLLNELHGAAVVKETTGSKTAAIEQTTKAEDDEITEKEFDALLDNLRGSRVTKDISTNNQTDANDQITEDEFEQLLDTIANTNATNQNNSAANKQSSAADKEPNQVEHKLSTEGTPVAKIADKTPETTTDKKEQDSDLITEAEFDTLLDELAQQPTNKQKQVKEESPSMVKPVDEIVSKQVVSDSAAEEKVQASHIDTSVVATKQDESNEHIEQVANSQTVPFAMPAPVPTVDTTVNKEDLKRDIKNIGSNMETTVRVDTNRLDQIMNMVGELVLVRNRMVKLKNASSNESIIKTVGMLDLVTADLQIAVMKTRMQPIKKVFGRFPRVVRDLARSLKKDISLEMVGEDTDLDKNLVEALADPLVHLVRNSVDHGIEMPDDRIKFGKPRTGKILLSAAQAGDHIILSIEDDGKGMDPEQLRNTAVERGVLPKDAADRLSNNECFELIFIPGFSTKQEISDISGRGVGMDVVKTKIAQLNGSIEITSELGKGNKITIKVPLTLAILPTLMIVIGQQPFALPLTCVNEIFDLDVNNTNIVDGQLVVIVRNKALPLFHLKDWLIDDEYLNEKETSQHVVVVSVGIQKIGFVVDKLLGQEEVVIKALGNMLHGTHGIAGATITGDGNIAMILDVPSLIKKYADKSRKVVCM